MLGAFRSSAPSLRATSRSAVNAKRIQAGLYDGRAIQSGNSVGETFNNKTRRTWLPNVHQKRLWSEALGTNLRLKVTAGALRTIDKVGGLDAYLFRMRPERLGEKGMLLRQMVRTPFSALPCAFAGQSLIPWRAQVQDAHARAKVQRRAIEAQQADARASAPDA
jgi:large subunit ribosomal protein L28